MAKNHSKAETLVPFIIAFYLANKLSSFYFLAYGNTSNIKLLNAYKDLTHFKFTVTFLLPCMIGGAILVGLIFAVVTVIYLASVKKQPKFNPHEGDEMGSAKWGKREDILPYMDTKKYFNNLLLTNSERLSMSDPKEKSKGVLLMWKKFMGKTIDWTYSRTKNVLVVGGTGSGKTYSYVIPNLLQKMCSYVVTDPKGTVLGLTGHFMKSSGYKIKIVNLIDINKTMYYNPFLYIQDELDIMKFVGVFIKNTMDKDEKKDFWVTAMTLLFHALVGFMVKGFKKEDQTFETLSHLINLMEVREDDENFKNKVDIMFDELESYEPNCFSMKQWKKYKLAAGKTAKSILISAGSRLTNFDAENVCVFTKSDELDLASLGDEKTILYVITSSTDPTLNFLAAILYTQMFDQLFLKAMRNKKNPGELENHVHCIFDEFANIGTIPNFDNTIAVIRSARISVSVILQSLSQLKNKYGDNNAATIIDNCDSQLYLGVGKNTAKELSEMLGKQTVEYKNVSQSSGKDKNSNTSYTKVARDLMATNEIIKMPGNKCILAIRGLPPFFSNKINVTAHKNYMFLNNKKDQFSFDVKKYLINYRKKGDMSKNGINNINTNK